MAKFDSFYDSARSFLDEKGSIVKGITDPTAFAKALQDRGGFGVYQNGTKVPDYVPNTAATIRSIQNMINRGQ